MSTNTRLSSLFETSSVIPYNSSSRIVLMSDCHRGTGSSDDNFLKNQNLFFAALSHYYDNNFTYIELGDGDELWENRDMQQIVSVHSNAFWLLSRFYTEGRFYMLYGNHDRIKSQQKFVARSCNDYYCDSESCRIPLLPGLCVYESLLLKGTDGTPDIFLVHGHQGDFLNDTCWKLTRFLVRYIWRPLELMAFKDPTSAAKNYTRKDAVEQRLSGWAKDHSQILAAGHTHRPVFPKPGKSLYFNCGSCVHPRCITALEIENACITLVKWSVCTDESLSLYVGKEILAGPAPLSSYLYT